MNGRKRFLRNALLFLLLVFAINMALNSVYDKWMIYHRLNRNQDRQFMEYSDSLVFLMMGNSHNMLNPAIIGNSFSYISPAEVYAQTYYKLRYILENTGKRPQYIVLSVDPANFSPKAENTLKFDGYWRKYVDYQELARITGDYNYYTKWFSGNYCAYVGNYKFIFRSITLINADFSVVKNGYRPPRSFRNFAEEPNRDALGLERATSYLAGYGNSPDLQPAMYFSKILTLCREYNIRPILVRMPLTNEYLEYAHQLVDLESLDRQIEKIAGDVTGDYLLFDFRTELSGRPEFFFNADHPNPQGADIISEKFKKLVSEQLR